MKDFSLTVDIQAPPARAWEILLDLEHWPEWTASMKSVKRLDQGPLKLGSQARVVQPKLRPAVWEVTELHPAKRSFTWINRSAGIQILGTHRIDKQRDGCRLTLSIAFSGLLSPIVGRLLGNLTRRYLALEANGLKQRSEA